MIRRPTWDETWAQVAVPIGQRSRCVRAQVGAVIVNVQQRIEATGYNGPAATFPEEGYCDSFCPRAMGGPVGMDYSACPSIHAEPNALMYVDRSRIEGGTIYVTAAMCMDCAKLVSNSGLARVVHSVITPKDLERKPGVVEDYLEKCGIIVDRAPGSLPKSMTRVVDFSLED